MGPAGDVAVGAKVRPAGTVYMLLLVLLVPLMKEKDKFLVDIVEADEVDLMPVREGCRAAGIWRWVRPRSGCWVVLS